MYTPDFPQLYLIHPCSIALITLYRNSYCNSTFTCLSPALDLAGWGCLWAEQCWPLKWTNDWGGLMSSPLWWVRINLLTLSLSLVLKSSITPFIDFIGMKWKTNETPGGQACGREVRLCKSKSFFYWRNKAMTPSCADFIMAAQVSWEDRNGIWRHLNESSSKM